MLVYISRDIVSLRSGAVELAPGAPGRKRMAIGLNISPERTEVFLKSTRCDYWLKKVPLLSIVNRGSLVSTE